MRHLIAIVTILLCVTGVYVQSKAEPDYTKLRGLLIREGVIDKPNLTQGQEWLAKEESKRYYFELIASYKTCTPAMVSEIITKLKKTSGLYDWPEDIYYRIMDDIHRTLGCTIPARNVVAARIIYDYGWFQYMMILFSGADEESVYKKLVKDYVDLPVEVQESLMQDIHAHKHPDREGNMIYADLMQEADIKKQLKMLGLSPDLDTAGMESVFELSGIDWEVQEALAHYLAEQYCDNAPIVNGRNTPSPRMYDEFYSRHKGELVITKVAGYNYVIFNTRKGAKISTSTVTDAFKRLINPFRPDEVKVTDTSISIFYSNGGKIE